MRKSIRLLVLMLLFSCAKNSNKERMSNVEDSTIGAYEIAPKNFTIEELTSQKLTSYFELLKLRNEHPEFNKDILLQLNDFSNQDFIKIDGRANFFIKNIHKVGEVTVLSDSTQRMKLAYITKTKYREERDSVYALITSKTVVLDGIETIATTIKFASIH